MNDVPQEQKDAVTKSFAIVGFIALLLIAVWIAVQVVGLIPSAFSSLASLADGVYNYEEEKTFMTIAEDSVINAGEPFNVSWETHKNPGTYAFLYECTEGVALSVRNQNGEMTDAKCDSSVQLGDTDTAEIIAESEKQRFVDVTYSILYTAENDALVSAVTSSEITLVNATIPTSVVLGDESADEEDVPEPEVAGETTEEPEEETTTPATPITPEVVEEIIYEIPVSDPNGTVDLAVRYMGVGILDSNDNFIAAGTMSTDQTGAFRFEVKNEGTKTSDAWTYEADLPSGISYDSGEQDPLKPNERAVITIGFDGISQTGVEQFGVTIDVDDDTSNSNNSFISAVSVTN